MIARLFWISWILWWNQLVALTYSLRCHHHSCLYLHTCGLCPARCLPIIATEDLAEEVVDLSDQEEPIPDPVLGVWSLLPCGALLRVWLLHSEALFRVLLPVASAGCPRCWVHTCLPTAGIFAWLHVSPSSLISAHYALPWSMLKTFIINDFFTSHSLDFLLLMETWAKPSDNSVFTEHQLFYITVLLLN